MTEAQVGFLYNIAATISKSQTDINNTILQSYYLMRCKDITRGYGLPDKHFSPKIRCPNCCLEWHNNSEIKVRSIKLSKRQKHRLKSKKVMHSRKNTVKSRKNLELEQVCNFCKNSTVIPVMKPQKQLSASTANKTFSESIPDASKNNTKTENTKVKPTAKKIAVSDVYTNALDIFSLQNKKNTLASTIKEKTKVINNSKKKKDKFAGLCQKAVLASTKLKDQKKNTNALNLFLKPST